MDLYERDIVEEDLNSGDVDEEEMPLEEQKRQHRRRQRDEFAQMTTSEVTPITLNVNSSWPVYVYRGALWFPERYSVVGVPGCSSNEIGWNLAHSAARRCGNQFMVRLEDSKGDVLYGSYKTHDDFVMHYLNSVNQTRWAKDFTAPRLKITHPVQNGLGSGVVTDTVSVTLKVRKKQTDEVPDNILVVTTAEYEMQVSKSSHRLAAVRCAYHKRLRAGNNLLGQMVVDDRNEFKEPDVSPIARAPGRGGEFRFMFTEETIQELTPCGSDFPCKLTVVLDGISEKVMPLIVQDFFLLLRTVFREVSDLRESGLAEYVFQENLLNYTLDHTTGKLFFVYNDPKVYFKNTFDLARFWSYVSNVLLETHEYRDTELVKFHYSRGQFTRKFCVDIQQFSRANRFLRNHIPIPVENDIRTQTPTPFSISSVSRDCQPVNVGCRGMNMVVTRTHTFSLNDIVRAIKGKNSVLAGITTSSFSLSTVRNRILFAPFALDNLIKNPCLYETPDYRNLRDSNGNLAYHPPYHDNHQCWISISLNNDISFRCQCRYPLDGQERDPDDPCSFIILGTVHELEEPESITFTTQLLDPQEILLPYGKDQVVLNQLNGIVDYLKVALNNRLVYCEGMWFIWSGELWKPDPEHKWTQVWLNRAVASFLNDYLDDIDESDKALRKATEKLRDRFLAGLGAARDVLTQLEPLMRNDRFKDMSRHRGYIAANNGVVDLKSGELRPYRCDDYITSMCAYNYHPCNCKPGTCFDKGSQCMAENIEAQRWIDQSVREITGCDFQQRVWYRDDGSKGRGPTSFELERAAECWVDERQGHERVESPTQQPGFTRLTSRLELAYEDGGLANYNRFRWALGYILNGFADLKLFIFGFGEQNNGKTLLWENIKRVFSNYMTSMHSSNVFAKGGSRADDGATPALVHVIGYRCGYVSEMSSKDVLNDASMKMWAGRDTQVGRFMRSEMITFQPDLVAVVNGNVKPQIDILDPAFWDRFFMLHYPITFVKTDEKFDYPVGWKLNERPRDPSYIPKFETPNNQEALFDWGIRAAIYQRNTTDCPYPQLVKNLVNDFKNKNNPIPAFINDPDTPYRYDINSAVPFKELYNDLKEWCKRENMTITKFREASLFRKLIRDVQDIDTDHRIELTGMVNTRGESVTGIIKVMENGGGMQVDGY